MTNPTSGIRLSDDWDDSGWVQVPRNILRDKNLTFKAMGLVAWLASHKAGFRINREFLYQASANGKDAVESGLKELRDAGYLTVDRVRDERGLLTADTDYVLHRYPEGDGPDQRRENPDAGDSSCVRVFPNQENPESGKSATKRDSVLRETQEERETHWADAAASAPEPAVDALFEAKTPVPALKAKDAKTATKRATTAPDALVITPAMREWAAREGITGNLEAETAQMLDHHRAKGTTFKDWTAGWRTWMRNSQKFAAQRTVGRRPFRDESGGFGEQYPDDPFASAA